MSASNRLTFCAIVLSVGLLVANTANAGNSGGSHAVSAPQQKSVRQSADFKLPNKPPASRRLQKRDATAVKTPAEKQFLGDYRRATKVLKKDDDAVKIGAEGPRYLKDVYRSEEAAQAAKDKKQHDDLEKQRQEKEKEIQDTIKKKNAKEGLENADVNAMQQEQKKRDDQNALQGALKDL